MGWQSAFFFRGVPKNDRFSQLYICSATSIRIHQVSIRGGVFCFTRSEGKYETVWKGNGWDSEKAFPSSPPHEEGALVSVHGRTFAFRFYIFLSSFSSLFFFLAWTTTTPSPPVREVYILFGSWVLVVSFLSSYCIWFKVHFVTAGMGLVDSEWKGGKQ